MNRPRIVLTHKADARTHWFGDAALDQLSAMGALRINPGNEALSGEALRDLLTGAEFIVLDRETRIGRDELENLPDLLAIVRSGVDCSMVDTHAASDKGILVVRAEAGYVESTAELGVGLLLSAARRIPHYHAAFQAGSAIAPQMGTELASATVGIVGHGRVGSYLARLVGVFGGTVLICDPALAEGQDGNGRLVVGLETLLDRSDFVILTTAVTDATRKMIDRAALARMKAHAWLVNIARGALIDEDALDEALASGRIGGVAMDVGSADDNIPAARFARFDNVIATPHIGNLTAASLRRQPENTVENLRQLIDGTLPATTLDRQAGARHEKWRLATKPAR